MQEHNKNKFWSLSNITTALLFALLISMFVFPEVKATMIRGLMQVGLFAPNTEKPNTLSDGETHEILLTDAAGKKISSAQSLGKVVIINFWATWCPPCRAELPSAQKVYGDYRNVPNIVFYLVDADGTSAESNLFLRDKKISIPNFDPAGPISTALFGNSLPTTIVLDKKGQVALKHEGAMNFSSGKFKSFIQKLLAEQ